MTVRGLGEIASDIELESGAWTVVVCAGAHLDETVEELADELAFAFEDGGEVIRIDAADGVESMVQMLSEKRADDVALIVHAERLDVVARQRLDRARTRFEGGPRVVLVLPEQALGELARDAPHLWSWLGARVYTVDPDSGKLDIEARLDSLRQGTGLTDEEVIRRARDGELPADPVYSEWLLLLGRGDLLG